MRTEVTFAQHVQVYRILSKSVKHT